MSMPKPVENDADKPIDINFVGQSPHVFAYRMWYRPPGEDDWTVIGEGDTQDDIPDHHVTRPHSDGTQIAIMAAIGGRPNSMYRYLITFSQEGAITQGGAIQERGKTSADGGAVKTTKVVLV
jgi:hypothetical protein